jgi:hypothetical protein
MRKRKYVIGATLALAASVAFAAVAQGVVVKQQILVQVPQGSKQDKKLKGAAGLDVDVVTTETAPTPAEQTASLTDVDFDKDFKFTPGTLKQCNPNSLANTTTDQAKAACPGSQVGFGTANSCDATLGCGGVSVPLTVTAFNGTPAGGRPTFLLHAKPGGIGAATPALVLVGTLAPSPLGAPYGQRLSVTVPDTRTTGLHLNDFHVFVLKQVTVKAKPTKAKPAKYYISANCSDKSWEFRSSTTFRGGAPTQTSTATVPCTQKKVAKK